MTLSRITGSVLAGFGLLVIAACRQDMHNQPKYKPQRPSAFFTDGRSERPPVEGAIARGELYEDAVFYTGKDSDDEDIETFPIAITREVIERGHQRFDIYCSPCHGRIGNGLGMIVRRGFKQPPSYHIDRLRNAPVGHFYDVITNGYGAMLNYAAQVEPRDRWAIISYIRVLQYSQNANVNDLSVEARTKLPQPGQEVPASVAQPLVPSDKEIQGFGQQAPLPSGVPGASGAGASPSNQPERK